MTTQLATRDGDTTTLDDRAVERLRARLAGRLLQPGDDGFDEATRPWNAMVEARPALVVQAVGAGDVAAAVDLARTEGIALSIRGGGHNIAGTSLVEGGLTVDLSQLRSVQVDPVARTAVVGGGCLLGDVDSATQEHGLATPLGFNSETGVGGLTLGGGFGYLTRRFGWACDNLLGVEMVTADGEIRTVDRDSDPDLFWAMRGAGANFGAVTSFTFRLHEVGPIVYGGLRGWPFERVDDFLAAYQALTEQAPRELAAFMVMLRAPAAPFVPEAAHGKRMCALTLCHSGDPETAEADLEPLHGLGPPVVDLVGPKPYTVMQSYIDATQPKGMHQYWKTEFAPGLNDDLLSTMAGVFADCPIPRGQVVFAHLEGAIGDRPDDDGAVGNRDAEFVFGTSGMWEPGDPAGQSHRDWVRGAWERFRGFSTGGNYVNFQTADESQDRIEQTYRDNFDRLLQVKGRYDPTNLFRSNRNLVG